MTSTALLWLLLIVSLDKFCVSLGQGDDKPKGNTSDVDRICHMLPGLYNNKPQHQLDSVRNISETERHQLMFVNISSLDKLPPTDVAHFLFVAKNPNFETFAVKREFIVRSFYVSGLVWFSVQNERTNLGSTSCDMMWKRTDSDTFRNIRAASCPVSGLDAEYTVNTSFELTESMFSLMEVWSEDGTVLPGPTTPYHFLKQDKGDNSLIL